MLNEINKGFDSFSKQLGVCLKQKPLLMGIINLTPDSFYPGSRYFNLKKALKAAFKMVEEGADIIDVGGESSRPGSFEVELKEEVKRVIPFIKEFSRESKIPISIDTRKAYVAKTALEAGARIINSISGFRDDEEFYELAKNYNAPFILMHMRGVPQTMQNNPNYNDTVNEIIAELKVLIEKALSKGLKTEQIIIDPGIGFGKRLQDNLKILVNIKRFKELGFPVLIGLSRKSFLGAITGREVNERLPATIAAQALALWEGADILRVHDVKEGLDVIKMVCAFKDIVQSQKINI